MDDIHYSVKLSVKSLKNMIFWFYIHSTTLETSSATKHFIFVFSIGLFGMTAFVNPCVSISLSLCVRPEISRISPVRLTSPKKSVSELSSLSR